MGYDYEKRNDRLVFKMWSVSVNPPLSYIFNSFSPSSLGINKHYWRTSGDPFQCSQQPSYQRPQDL